MAAVDSIKSCSLCGELKPNNQFYKVKSRNYGLSSWCKACTRIRSGEWRATNPERARKSVKAWHADPANKDQLRGPVREWKRRNKDKVRQGGVIYRKNNAEKIREVTRRMQAARVSATPRWANKGEMRKFYAESIRLTEQTGIPHEVDHIVPVISRLVCGLHCEANLRVITKDENRAKRNYHWPDMP